MKFGDARVFPRRKGSALYLKSLSIVLSTLFSGFVCAEDFHCGTQEIECIPYTGVPPGKFAITGWSPYGTAVVLYNPSLLYSIPPEVATFTLLRRQAYVDQAGGPALEVHEFSREKPPRSTGRYEFSWLPEKRMTNRAACYALQLMSQKDREKLAYFVADKASKEGLSAIEVNWFEEERLGENATFLADAARNLKLCEKTP